MVWTTLQPERMCRQSEIPAFFCETVQFSGQEGEAGLFYQGHFPATATNVAQVYIRGDQGLLLQRRFRHDLFSLAEVPFGIAEDGVDLGQGYPHGYPLYFSMVCPSRTSWYRNRTT